jgi:hypothetical protein
MGCGTSAIADYKSPAELMEALRTCGVLEDVEIMVDAFQPCCHEVYMC